MKFGSSLYFHFENVHMNVFVVRFAIEMTFHTDHKNMFSLQRAIASVCLGRQTVQMHVHNTCICGLLKIQMKTKNRFLNQFIIFDKNQSSYAFLLCALKYVF